MAEDEEEQERRAPYAQHNQRLIMANRAMADQLSKLAALCKEQEEELERLRANQ